MPLDESAAADTDPRLQETDFVPPEVVDPEANRVANDAIATTKQTPGGGASSGTNGESSASTGANRYGTVQPAEPSKPAASARVLAPDLLRGLLMVFQSLDHAAVSLGAWRHGVALESEADGQTVTAWNSGSAWFVRMLTHLCAPGFMFLLGMGVVYFGRSRSKLGWSTGRMVKHFAVRCFALFLVNEVLGTGMTGGRFLMLNIVLVALAVNYLIAGLIWLLVNKTEQLLAEGLSSLDAFKENEDTAASAPLLAGRTAGDSPAASPHQRVSKRAASWSWHAHNALLLVLAMVTIWWNVWLSPDHGHCSPAHPSPPINPDGGFTRLGIWFDFWFYPVQSRTVVSPFPPLAWLSFAILGLLYGRLVTARSWPVSTLNVGNAAASAVFFALFAATRLLQIGNLSEGCLQMPEQHGGNQYLASFRAFFYIIKYPPSVAYLCFTMSINHLLLAFFGALPAGFARRIPALLTFGTSALFFYVLHLLIYFTASSFLVPWIGHDLGYWDPIREQPAKGLGNTWQYWLVWFMGIVILVPSCRWYGRFKSSKGPDSIWRFF